MKRVVSIVLLSLSVPAFAAKEKKIDRPPQADARPLTVTLDVKDDEVRDILKSMQRQCEIKNLIVDPQVQGKGTFFLRHVPCNTAFDVVLRTLRLKSVTYSSSVVAVEKRP